MCPAEASRYGRGLATQAQVNKAFRLKERNDERFPAWRSFAGAQDDSGAGLSKGPTARRWLTGSEATRYQLDTLRLRLLKIVGRVRECGPRIRLQ